MAGIGAGGDHRDGEKARALRFSSRDFSEHGISEISEVDKPAQLRWSECARLSPRIWKGVADIFAVVAGKVVSRACERGVLDWVAGKGRLLLDHDRRVYTERRVRRINGRSEGYEETEDEKSCAQQAVSGAG